MFSNAQFTYDGDGRRVKSVITNNVGSTTTFFVGAHYEVVQTYTGTQVNKYYFAGSQRIAMRQGATLYYLLSDHLGSTSIVTDASGQVISQTKYKAWGEVRYSSGASPTDFTFTGQKSHVDSFGLMFYQSRYYDPSLSRFISADSIVPAGAQGLDRYGYTNNNPVRYTDPSGHLSCSHANVAEGDCEDRNTIEILRDEYDITLNTDEQQFTEREISAIYKAARSVGAAFARDMMGVTSTVSEAFKKIYDPLTFKKVDEFYYQGIKYDAGCKTEGNTITCAPFAPQSGYFQSATNNIVHELGHVFEPNSGSGIPSIFVENRNNILYNNDTIMWQANDARTPGETFGDFFVAWVYGVWGPKADDVWRENPSVGSAKGWMTTNMSEWINP